MEILAGDIGGTKTRLGLFRLVGRRLQPLAEETFDSRRHASFETLLDRFLASHPVGRITACFGVAGPIHRNRARTTNLPWSLDGMRIGLATGLARVELINDLEAVGWGIEDLAADTLVELQAGDPEARGNGAVIAAGTGLGEAGLYWDGARHIPFATEGGHADFSPSSPLEFALAEALAARYGHVSWERIVSGPGLVEIFRFLLRYRGARIAPWLRDALDAGDPAAVISQTAHDAADPICVESLDLFVHLYGAEAGNLALKTMARGGVYLGGGIAPKIIERLRAPGFLESFRAKGRMGELLAQVPVRVIMNDRAGLIGPARLAAHRASEP